VAGDAADVLLAPQFPPATSKNPPSFIACLLFFSSFCGDGSSQYNIGNYTKGNRRGQEGTAFQL